VVERDVDEVVGVLAVVEERQVGIANDTRSTVTWRPRELGARITNARWSPGA